MKKRLFSLTMAIVMLALTLTGCQGGKQASGGAASAAGDQPVSGETVKIGFPGSLAGSGAYVDVPAKLALEDYIAELNENGGLLGKKVELVSYDVSRDPATESITAVNRMIQQDKVFAILGPSGSSSALPIISLCDDNKIPCISNSATNPKVTVDEATGKVYPYMFRVCFIDPYQGTALADFAYNELKITKIASLTRINNAYAQGVMQYFKEQYEKLGGELVQEMGYQENEVEFRAQLSKAADAGATALLVASNEYKDAALVAKQAKDLKLNFTYLFPDGVYASELLEAAGSELEGSYISVGASEDEPAFAEFKKTFDEKHKSSGYTANIYVYYALDTMKLLEYAVKKANSFDGEAIKNELEHATNVQLFTEPITIEPDTHNPHNKSVTILQVKDRKYSVHKTYKPAD